MRNVTWCLVAGIIVVGCGWLVLVWTVWHLRHTFEIAARSPLLVCICEIAALELVLSVLLHWLLLLEGRSMPCYGIYWTSYIACVFGDVPYLIRAARLVVAFNKEYHYKYARFVKWKPMTVVWAVCTIGLVVRASLFFGTRPGHGSRDARHCFYFDDIFLLGLVVVLAGGSAALLSRVFSEANDTFRIRQELQWVFGLVALLAGLMTAIQVLVILQTIPDSRQAHVVVEIFALLYGVTVGIWGLIVPLAEHYRLWKSEKEVIHPVRESSPGETTIELDGVLEFAKAGEATGDRFGEFCRASLCVENWNFIVEAVRYQTDQTMEQDTDSQYNAFVHILNQFLLPTSPDEVNICSAMRKRLTSYNSREVFGSLNKKERHDILKHPLDEVVRMLEQNLLTKFRLCELQRQELKLVEDVKGDRELMKLISLSSADSV